MKLPPFTRPEATMDENLVGYLLQLLDEPTRAEVEARVKADPETRARLDRLEKMLAPLGVDREHPAAPPGLVIDTLARIAEARCPSRPLTPAAPRRLPLE